MQDKVFDPEAVDALSLDHHPASEPVIDWAALAQFSRAGAAGQLIALFLADAPATLLALQTAVAHQDAVGLRQAAHSLKGSSTYMGARILAARLAELERIGRDGSVDGAVALLADVEHEFARVREMLTKERPA